MLSSPEWWFGLAIALSGGALLTYGCVLMARAYGFP
jgi:hypothetical protein